MRSPITVFASAICIVFFFFGCEKGDEALPPTSIVSVSPPQAAEGADVKITVENVGKKSLSRIKVGDVELNTWLGGSETPTIKVPYLKNAGKYDITLIYLNEEPIILKEAFEFLPINFKSTTAGNQAVGRETVFKITFDNTPKGVDIRDFVFFKEKEGVKTVTTELKATSVKGDDITIVARRNDYTKTTEKFYVAYHDQEFEIPGLVFVSPFKIWKNSIMNYPDNHLWIYNRLGYGELRAYANGVELPKLASTSLTSGGLYSHISEFRTPLSTGDYKITCFDPNGIEVFSDSVDVVNLSDIYMCPEKTSYLTTDEVKINLSSGYLNPYDCKDCPAKVVLTDNLTNNVFNCTIKSSSYREYFDPNTSYLTFMVPAGVWKNTFYRVEIYTSRGYLYVPSNPCGGLGLISFE